MLLVVHFWRPVTSVEALLCKQAVQGAWTAVLLAGYRIVWIAGPREVVDGAPAGSRCPSGLGVGPSLQCLLSVMWVRGAKAPAVCR